jgi:pilus assembly protein CpaF
MMTSPASPGRLTAADLVKFKYYLIDTISRALEGEALPTERRRDFVLERLKGIYDQTKLQLPEDIRSQIYKEVLDELLGYGPIQPLLEDEEISEVMVNGPKKIYIEKKGRLTKTPITFEDDAHVIRIIERIVLPLGRRIDAENATVDARLPDGSRVNAVVPPVAIDGPSITIRKFRKDKLTIDQLIQYGSITQGMADFLQACILARLNIVISGGTGSGKTTLLNLLSNFIPEE